MGQIGLGKPELEIQLSARVSAKKEEERKAAASPMAASFRWILQLHRDVPKAARFYSEGLDFTVNVCSLRWAELQSGSLKLALMHSSLYFSSHALHLFDDCSFLIALINHDHNVHGSLMNSNMLEKTTNFVDLSFFFLIFDGFTCGPNDYVLKEMFGLEYWME